MAKETATKEGSNKQMALHDDETLAAMRAAYDAAGIAMPAELDAPEPDVAESIDSKSLCSEPTRYPGAENESPLLILMTEPKIYPSDLDGAKSFFTATVFDSKRKKSVILTSGYERVDKETGEESISPLGLHLQKLTPGKSVFKIATFRTRKNFHVIRPIPIS